MSRITIFTFLVALTVQANAIQRPQMPKLPNQEKLSIDASFSENVVRYPSPNGVMAIFEHLVPYQQYTSRHGKCAQMEDESIPLIGAIDPLQLQPLEPEPGAFFYQFAEECIKNRIQLGFGDDTAAKKNTEIILGADYFDMVKTTQGTIGYLPVTSLPQHWIYTNVKDFKPELLNNTVDRMILYIVGPEVILRHYAYIGDNNVFNQPLQTKEDLRNFLIQEFVSSENFQPANDSVTMSKLYSRIAVLLRLGPALKH